MTQLSSVSQILSSRTLKQLLKRVRDQDQLLKHLREIVPSPLAAHCLAATLSDERLTVYVDSPAWASKIRYLSRQIAHKFNNKDRFAKEVRVKVLVGGGTAPTRRQHALPTLSEENAALLRSVAADIADPQLSATLQRLSRKAGKRSQ